MRTDPATGEVHRDDRNHGEQYGQSAFFQDIKATHLIECLLAVLLVMVTTYQAILIRDANRIAGEAANAARESVEQAKESTTLARRAIELAGDTAETELRAYVLPTKTEVLRGENGVDMTVRFTVRNSGQTPAQKLSLSMGTRWDNEPTIAGDIPGQDGIPISLAAGESFYIEHKVKKPRWYEFDSGKAKLVAIGSVDYRDVYDKLRVADYEFESIPGRLDMALVGGTESLAPPPPPPR